MKTYKDEYRELAIWRRERSVEARKLPKGKIGFDLGLRAKQRRLDGIEYRRRLRELKVKHGMPVDF